MTRKEALRQIGGLALAPLLPGLIISRPPSGRQMQPDTLSGGKIILQPFEYGEIRLENSALSRQVEGTKEYYLRIPNDDLLKGFRERMHLSTYGARDLGGWYSADVFHVFGQLLSGLSRLYAVTGDAACKEKVTALIEGWAECIDGSGYFYYTGHPNAKHYVYDKMVGGLVDAYVFTGHKNALSYLSRITDWAVKNLNKQRPYAKTSPGVSNEWYTLAENLYRAYELTHDKKYLDFGNYWEYTVYWDLLARKESIFRKHVNYHAYSHLNTLSSAAMAYMVKGEERYLAALKNGYVFFREEECFATGGFGPNEKLLPKAEIVELLRNTHNSFETQCGSWAAFKLCRYLLMLTGDAQYGDWIEKLIYNGAGADIPMSAGGGVLYYSDYNPREGKKSNYFKGWSCCTGTRPEAVAEYGHLAYFKKGDGLYVNLYTPSYVAWNGITLVQRTRFPEHNETAFDIGISGKNSFKDFALYFRKPSWLAAMPQFFLNDRPVKVSRSGNWLQLRRQWKDGDRLKVIFPMQLAVSRLDKSQKYPAAITCGPVVMAIRAGSQYPAGLLEGEDPLSAFVPVEGAPLNYHVKGMPDVLIRPYYQFKEDEPYILYLDPEVKNRVSGEHIQQEGTWKRWRGTGYYFSNQKGAALSAVFTGRGIRLYLNRFPDAGKCLVKIDGKQAGIIDLYGPEKHMPFRQDYPGLENGNHRVTVIVLGEKNDASKNRFVNLSGFEVLK